MNTYIINFVDNREDYKLHEKEYVNQCALFIGIWTKETIIIEGKISTDI